jgi:subtilase family serine protease
LSSPSWIKAIFGRTRQTQSPIRSRPQSLRLDLEELEPRVVLSVSVDHIVASGSKTTTTTSTKPVLGHLGKNGTGPLVDVKSSKAGTTTATPAKNHLSPFSTVVGKKGTAIPATSSGSAAPGGLSPAQIETYYGINSILLQGGVVGNGAGQTIAIVDAFDNPNLVSSTNPASAAFIASDLYKFDAQFGIAQPVAGQFIKESQTGTAVLPASGKGTGWIGEEDLDVEWAHALAPAANIILIEAASSSDASLIQTAVKFATTIPSVSVISMSFGEQGATDPSGGPNDAVFHTPAGHQGITFLAATGDNNAVFPPNYPADSLNVVAVGGTVLTPAAVPGGFTESGWGNGNGTFGSSSSGGGGGIGGYSEPSYQKILVPTSSYGGLRTNPDVSFDAGTAVSIVDQLDGNPKVGAATPWLAVEGTSFACPAWAALIAIANQDRAIDGLTTLDGVSQTLPRLYTLGNAQYNQGGSAVYHDVTTGNNGYAAGTGYDLVTGIGSPRANLLVTDLAITPHFTATAAQTSTIAGIVDQITITVLDPNNVTLKGYTGTVDFSSSDSRATLPANYSFTTGAGKDNGVHTFNVTLVTAGTQTVTVTDPTNAITASVTIKITAAPANHFVESGSQVGKNLFSLTIYAEDQYGNIDTNFKGTVNFSSSLSSLPGSYTFTGSGTGKDNGVHTFTMALPSSYGVWMVDVSALGLASLDFKVFKLIGWR